jgi:hypothetical protein
MLLNNQTNYLAVKYNEAFNLLLEGVVRDLRDGKGVDQAGILPRQELPMSESEVQYLIRNGLLREKGELGVQITFDVKKTRLSLQYFDLKFKQIDYFKNSRETREEDESRISAFEIITQHVVEQLLTHPEVASGLTVLGIYEMLESSEMAAPLDRVLNEGLSPQAWFKECAMALPSLALDFCAKFDSKENIISSMEKAKTINLVEQIPKFSRVESNEVVKRVLQTEKMIDVLHPDDIKMLGMYWFFSRKMKEEAILPLYEDASVSLMTCIQTILEKQIGFEIAQNTQRFEGSISLLNSLGITWASNFVRIPEVI